jgi:hypothetical protein
MKVQWQVNAFRAEKAGADDKFVLAAGWASISLTTPTITGIGTELLENEVRTVLRLVARRKPPPAGMKLEELDPEFAKAILTQLLERLTWRFFSQHWTILSNPTDEPFLTSDNPSATFGQDLLGSPPARVLPLSPEMSVSTRMDFDLVVPERFGLDDLKTGVAGKVTFEKCHLEQARFANCLIVKHAGDLVFSSKRGSDVATLVASLHKLGVRLDHTAMSMEEIKATLSIAKIGIGNVR